MGTKFELSRRPLKMHIKKYSNSTKLLNWPVNTAKLAIGISILATILLLTLLVGSNSSANTPKGIDDKRPSKRKEIFDLSFCISATPVLNGQSAVKCHSQNFGQITFEYFETTSAIDMFSAQNGLEAIHRFPGVFIRIGEYENQNRLLVADSNTRSIYDVRSDSAQEVLLDWLTKVLSSELSSNMNF